MQMVMYLSDFVFPFLVFWIVGYGAAKGRPVFEDFLTGAKRGVHTVAEIAPTVIGLMVMTAVLRASGLFDVIARLLSPVTEWIHFPAPLLPLAVGATVLVLSGERDSDGSVRRLWAGFADRDSGFDFDGLHGECVLCAGNLLCGSSDYEDAIYSCRSADFDCGGQRGQPDSGNGHKALKTARLTHH